MAVIKIACPKCGQKVSGDETFYGRSVNCPICTSKIIFPDNPGGADLDSLSSAPPEPAPGPAPSQPSFETMPPSSQPAFDTVPPAQDPPSQPSQPAFETINPSMQPTPPAQPSFDTVAPGTAPQNPGPSFDELPPTGGAIPPVPQAPDIPAADENDEVPSPLLGSVSLVVGILNIVTACVGGVLLAPVGIILGHAALAKAKHSPVKPAPGQNLAMIGVILGYAGLASTIILLIAFIIFKEPMMQLIQDQASEAA